jgi:hypothetical protein
MRITAIAVGLFASSLAALLLALPYQGPIEQQLKAQYPLTRVGMGGLVIQAGGVLIVQQDNIKAIPASSRSYYPNYFKKGGRVGQSLFNKINHAASQSASRFLQVGEGVYVTNIDVRITEIVLSLQSCGACDSSAIDPNEIPYRAELSFQFQKGFVDVANFDEIRGTIAEVLAFPPDPPDAVNTSTSNPPSSDVKSLAAEDEAAPSQLPMPASTPPAVKAIGKDDTREQVVEAFGQPEKIIKLESKEIYYFKDLKVVFIDGKVSDIQ